MRNRRIMTAVSQSPDSDDQSKRRVEVGRPLIVWMVVVLSIVLVVTRMDVGNQAPSPNDALSTRLPASNRRRFPRHGTPEFAQQCNWTMHPVKQHDCIILSRPPAQQHEGLAEWVSMAVSRFIVAKLQGCQLLLDYGRSVDLHQVLLPHDNNTNSNNWTVPTGFTECILRNKCSTAGFQSQSRESSSREKSSSGGQIPIPIYRHAFTGAVQHNMYRKTFQHLAMIPGFDLETGMACAFESLFQLSPAALQFQPELFTDILPKVRDPHSLVLTLYIRTNHADATASAEKKGEVGAVETTNEAVLKKRATLYLPCVLDVEQQYLSSKSSSSSSSLSLSSSYARVVWMMVSDSPLLKEWIAKEYTVPNVVNTDVGSAAEVENDDKIPREVITTNSRGVHTRAARNPSTADFAEGMIDWYLIGESDAVIANGLGFSFGTTGALRTNRPLYNFDYACGGSCTRRMLVHEEDPPTSEQLHFVVR